MYLVGGNNSFINTYIHKGLFRTKNEKPFFIIEKQMLGTVSYLLILSILLIKRTSVTISAKFNAGDPGQSSAHLLAYRFEGNLRLAFDDEFVMDMTADAGG